MRFIVSILPSAAESAAVTMSGKDLMSTLRWFDAYPKTLEDFRVKTFGGAAGKCYAKSTVAVPRFSYDRTECTVMQLFDYCHENRGNF